MVTTIVVNTLVNVVATKEVTEMCDEGGVPLIYKGDMSKWIDGRTTDSHVVVFGSSIGAGSGADTPSQGWAWKLFNALQALYGNGGEFLSTWFDGGILVNEVTRWTITSGWYGGGIGPHGDLETSSPGTATATLNFNALDVFNLIGSLSEAYTIKIDAEAPTSIGGPGSLSYTKTSYSRSAGNHTVQFGAPSSNYAWMSGVSARNASGLICVNSSVSGGKLSSHSGYTGSLYNVAMLPLMPSCLAIISLTINDYLAQTSLVDYETTLDALLNAIGSDVYRLLVTEASNGNDYAIPQSSYDDINHKMALKYNCGFININGLWENYENAVSLGYMNDVDKSHPIQAGHDYIKDVIYQLLTT